MAEDLNSLIAGFTEGIPGVIHAAIVSTVGLPLACSEGFPPDLVDQLAAVTSGLTSMVGGAARMLGAGPVARIGEMAVLGEQAGNILSRAARQGGPHAGGMLCF